MPGTTTPSAIEAQSQSQQQTTKPARRRRTTSTPTAETQGTPRLAVSILPPGHFMRAGGADLSPAERQLIEDFRQMNGLSRETLLRFTEMVAAQDREKRISEMAPKFKLVKGGAV